jgi:ABC-type dipeptide/oligopeptide/nickel transport system permease subunit
MPEPRQPVDYVTADVGNSAFQAAPTVAPGLAQQEVDRSALLAAREGMPIEARSQFRMALDRFLHHKVALFGIVVFVLFVLVSVFGQHFWHYKYAAITGQFASGPDLQHPLGTDTIGHDMFAQVMSATATSLQTAVIVAVLSTIVGTLIGALAGYYGKWADAALMRFTDLVLVVPAIALLLVLAGGLSSFSDSTYALALVLAALFWTYLARLVRGAFLGLREREFVEAEWAIGASDRRIILRHLIPNAAGPIVVNATLTLGQAMLVEAALSFLGLGIQPPHVSLGLLISQGEGSASVFPWLFYAPAAVLVIIILCVNFIGDGLRDALDPTQRVRT